MAGLETSDEQNVDLDCCLGKGRLLWFGLAIMCGSEWFKHLVPIFRRASRGETWLTVSRVRSELLRAKYRDMWATGERCLRAGKHKSDAIPLQGDKRWGLSVVLMLEGSLRDALRPELDALSSRRRTPHLVYDPHHLHSTVRSLEGFQDDVPSKQVEYYADQIQRLSAGLPAMEIEYVGLSGSAGGVFACGYPTDSLQALRQRLHQEHLAIGPLGTESADSSFARDTAHASLMVFRAPLRPEPEIADYISSRTETYFGTVKVRGLSLVRYLPTHDSVCLTNLAQISL